MKKIKFTAFFLLSVIFVLLAGETAYYRVTDNAAENFSFIYFSRIYNANEIAADILSLTSEYDLSGFFIVYDESDRHNDTYYCTDKDISTVKERLRLDDGSFDTILSGGYNITFKALSQWTENEKIIDGFYVDGPDLAVNELYNSLSEKYDCQLRGKSSSHNWIVLEGAVCAALILLLSVYDALRQKRDICISLTLGKSLTSSIVKNQLVDMAGFVLLAVAVYIVMGRTTAVSLIPWEYIVFVAAACIADISAFWLLYFADVCSAIKNSNKSASFLPINYLLKLISCALLIALISLFGEIGDNIPKKKAAEDFEKYFSGYSYIELSESPYWAEQIDSLFDGSYVNSDVTDLIEQEFKDYDTFLKAISQEGEVFLLNAFSFYDAAPDENSVHEFNVVLASDSAGAYLEAQTNTRLSADNVTLLLPENYDPQDYKACLGWLGYFLPENGDGFETASYKSAEIGVFGHYDPTAMIAPTASFCMLSSPIVIYVPNAAEYGFFGEQNLQTGISRADADRILSDNDIRSAAVEMCSVSSRAGGYISQLVSTLTVYAMAFAAILFYFMIVSVSTAMLDIKIYRKDRAIKKILGQTFMQRYCGAFAKIALSTALSGYAAYTILDALKIRSSILFSIAIPAVIITGIELIFMAASGIADDKMSVVKTLKGGAL